MRKILTLAFIAVLSLQVATAVAQDADTSTVKSSDLSLSLEIKSRHAWRGGLTTRSWNMQPTIEYSGIKNLTLGAWGCYTVNNEYAEVDLYASYSLGNFNLTLYDYFCPTPTEDGDNHHFFNFDRKVSGHTFDACLSYSFSNIPLTLTASTAFFGDGRSYTIEIPSTNPNADPEEIKYRGYSRYSTYLEANYTQTLKSGQRISYFIGGTTHDGMYYSTANIVNLGFKVEQDIMIGSYALPVNGSIVVNPARGNIYFIVGVCPF